jgi:hypothetical protein
LENDGLLIIKDSYEILANTETEDGDIYNQFGGVYFKNVDDLKKAFGDKLEHFNQIYSNGDGLSDMMFVF